MMGMPVVGSSMAPTPQLGDPLPPALARYWEAIDGAGRFREAAACFSDDTLYAVPPPDVVEVAPRIVTVGSAALLERFVERGHQPWRHVAVICVATDSDALVEGVLCDTEGRSIATYVCSASFGPDGRISRYLAFSCPRARDAIPTDVDATGRPADAAEVVHRYFADLDSGHFADAAAHFSDDVLYSHPPYQHTEIEDQDRIEFRGRAALQAGFERRGVARFDHDVITSIQNGPHCLFEGAVRGLPDDGTGSFISSLSLAHDGTIRRYVSFYCEPGIPTRK
ncbi:MAG TPA: nuclear transport factor 2 family protein [Ilumatobacteraceae bacterium]